MSVTIEQVRERFPGAFDALADAALQAAVDEAARRVNRDVLGDWSDDGTLYLAAHLASFARGSGAGITSATVGGVSVTFAGAERGVTQYSALYDELVRSAVPGLVVL